MHDVILFFESSNVVDHSEALKETVESVEFENDDDINVTNVTFDVREGEEMTAPNGETVMADGMTVVTFNLELPEETDYAFAPKALGLEVGMNHLLRREAGEELTEAVKFDAKVNRTKHCDHPEEQREFAEKTTDYCGKCGGPAIEVEG